jgi:hypothetical protein
MLDEILKTNFSQTKIFKLVLTVINRCRSSEAQQPEAGEQEHQAMDNSGRGGSDESANNAPGVLVFQKPIYPSHFAHADICGCRNRDYPRDDRNPDRDPWLLASSNPFVGTMRGHSGSELHPPGWFPPSLISRPYIPESNVHIRAFEAIRTSRTTESSTRKRRLRTLPPSSRSVLARDDQCEVASQSWSHTSEPGGCLAAKDKTFECLFWYVGCAYKSRSERTWKAHCRSHFRGAEPPKHFACENCDAKHLYERTKVARQPLLRVNAEGWLFPEQHFTTTTLGGWQRKLVRATHDCGTFEQRTIHTFTNGWRAWEQKMQHYVDVHAANRSRMIPETSNILKAIAVSSEHLIFRGISHRSQ